MIVRSNVKVNWISRQYVSSAATSSGGRSETAAVAAFTWAIPAGRTANAAPPAIRRNERRLHIVIAPPLDGCALSGLHSQPLMLAAQYNKHPKAGDNKKRRRSWMTRLKLVSSWRHP